MLYISYPYQGCFYPTDLRPVLSCQNGKPFLPDCHNRAFSYGPLVAAIRFFELLLIHIELAWEVGRIHGSIDCFSNIGHANFEPTSAPLCYSCASSSRMTCVAGTDNLLPLLRALIICRARHQGSEPCSHRVQW